MAAPMNEPVITCPNCKTEVKLTESLAAPLLESIRTQYEEKLTQKDADIARREASLHAEQATDARSPRIFEKLLLKSTSPVGANAISCFLKGISGRQLPARPPRHGCQWNWGIS